jgi:hypothetical protein
LIEYSVEHTSIECRWVFKRMLPSLPGPGTPAFANLVKGLHSFGIDPAGVSVDAPSSRMGDLVLSIVLLEKRVVVRLTASSFELIVAPVYVGDETTLVEIAELILTALSEIDAEAHRAEAKIRTSSHLSLTSANAETFLVGHLNLAAPDERLVPDAVAYKVSLSEGIHSSGLRVVISKSIAYKNAIFVEVFADYSEAAAPETLATWVNADFETIMRLLALTEGEEKQ